MHKLMELLGESCMQVLQGAACRVLYPVACRRCTQMRACGARSCMQGVASSCMQLCMHEVACNGRSCLEKVHAGVAGRRMLWHPSVSSHGYGHTGGGCRSPGEGLRFQRSPVRCKHEGSHHNAARAKMKRRRVTAPAGVAKNRCMRVCGMHAAVCHGMDTQRPAVCFLSS